MAELSIKKLEVQQDSDILIERLSVFLLYSDEDGREDYNLITIIHNSSGLLWQLNRGNSSFFVSKKSTKQQDTQFWAGSNKIAYPLGKMPIGEYTIIAEDLSGNRDIKSFSLKSEDPLSSLPFQFSISNQSWEIINNESSFSVYSLVLLGADKQPMFVKTVSDSSNKINGSLEDLTKDYPDARYIQCIAENTQKTMAYMSKAYNLD